MSTVKLVSEMRGYSIPPVPSSLHHSQGLRGLAAGGGTASRDSSAARPSSRFSETNGSSFPSVSHSRTVSRHGALAPAANSVPADSSWGGMVVGLLAEVSGDRAVVNTYSNKHQIHRIFEVCQQLQKHTILDSKCPVHPSRVRRCSHALELPRTAPIDRPHWPLQRAHENWPCVGCGRSPTSRTFPFAQGRPGRPSTDVSCATYNHAPNKLPWSLH
jgi:hypothetical protein